MAPLAIPFARKLLNKYGYLTRLEIAQKMNQTGINFVKKLKTLCWFIY